MFPVMLEATLVFPICKVQLIKETGGVAILAHPLLYHMSTPVLQKMTDELKGAMAYTGVKTMKDFDPTVIHRL